MNGVTYEVNQKIDEGWGFDEHQCVLTESSEIAWWHLVKPWGCCGVVVARAGASGPFGWPVFKNWEIA